KVRKSAVSLSVGGNAGVQSGSLANASPLIVAEDKKLVLADRASRRTTELVPPQLPFSLLRTEEILIQAHRIEFVVAQELPGRAVELVGSGLDCGINDRSAGSPEFRAEVAGLHLEFLNCVGRRKIDVRRAVQEIDGVVVIVNPVQQVAVVPRCQAVRHETSAFIKPARRYQARHARP